MPTRREFINKGLLGVAALTTMNSVAFATAEVNKY